MDIRGNSCKVLNNLFGTFRLSSSRLATKLLSASEWISTHDIRDEDALILSLVPHINPCSFCYCKDMRWIFVPTLIAILLYNCIRVQWQILIRIDSYKE